MYIHSFSCLGVDFVGCLFVCLFVIFKCAFGKEILFLLEGEVDLLLSQRPRSYIYSLSVSSVYG